MLHCTLVPQTTTMADENSTEVKWHETTKRTLLEWTIFISEGSLANLTTDKWRLQVKDFNAATGKPEVPIYSADCNHLIKSTNSLSLPM